MELEVKKELFNNVYGYDDVKRELSLIKSWFKNPKFLNNKKITLPKGIIFHGDPGCGKTLLLREFSNSFNVPKFIISGKEDNISNEIINIFTKAKNEEFALILIDEIDLLIGRDEHIERTLQEQIDGINTKGKILVLATTNHLYRIADALKRPGRFDRKIEISYPDRESRAKMFAKFLDEISVDTKNIDFKHLARIISNVTGADIKAICNDAYLRCENNISTDDIETSYQRVVKGNFSKEPTGIRNKRVAIHEAGHSLMTLHFNDNWNFYCSKFNKGGGITETQEVVENYDSFRKREEKLMIGLSGFIAEELCLGRHDIGAYADYSSVHELAKGFIEKSGLKGYKHFIPPYQNNNTRYETPKKRAINERIIDRVLRKYERKTRKYLKKHILDINNFANFMLDKGIVTYKDIPTLNLEIN